MLGVLAVPGLVALNGFFVAAEFALVAIRRTKVEEMVTKLNDMEEETDQMGMALARTLFSKEDEMKPLCVIFWYQTIQWIGDLADYAEKVGDRMRLLIAR